MDCSQSFVTIHWASGTIFAVDLVGYMDKFICGWNSWMRSYWGLYRKWKSLSHVQLFATPWTIVHGILQAGILVWVAIPFSRVSSQPRDQTQLFHFAGAFFTSWATREIFVKRLLIKIKPYLILALILFSASEFTKVFRVNSLVE